eukprot:3326937-Pleurochrysis_carterae.AAC.1
MLYTRARKHGRAAEDAGARAFAHSPALHAQHTRVQQQHASASAWPSQHIRSAMLIISLLRGRQKSCHTSTPRPRGIGRICSVHAASCRVRRRSPVRRSRERPLGKAPRSGSLRCCAGHPPPPQVQQHPRRSQRWAPWRN